MKILVADDDDNARRVLEIILAREDMEVIATRDGDEAMHHLFGPKPPDIAVLDWMMPGHSGIDVCKRVRQFSQEHYTYLILLTARGLQEDVIAGLEAGADDYLVKPYDIKEFLLRVKTGRRLIELQRELARKNELLQDLNYALAHDLKTPLIAIEMTTNNALDGDYGAIPDDYKRVLQKTKHSISSLLRMTETMRTLARFEHSDQQKTLQEVDLRDLASRCAGELEPIIASKRIKFHLLSATEQMVVVGDTQDFERLLINLLDNSIKFTPEGGEIKLKLDMDESKVRIAVFDSGPGVSEIDRPQLFKRFSRGSDRRQASGTGLGLYLCKRIADLHRGTLTYETDAELGPAFVFELPRSMTVESVEARQEIK